MSRFAQFLLKKQLLMPEQLEQALQHQAVYGARLGTNLVELRILTVERLAECLAEFHRIPLPPRAWIERPKRNAIEKVTRPLVERIRFIPMRLENNNILHAAVLDPNDPVTLDDLRFATGCKIQPYVLPEIWMHDWLFTLFKLPRGIRHIDPDAENDRELEKPAQSYDFQAAQAAIAAKANRIMQPAIVGVVEGSDAKPTDRKTLQGVDRAAVLAEARAAAAGQAERGGAPAEPPARAPGERTTFHGVVPVGERTTAQGYRPPAAALGERAPPAAAERPAAPPPRPTMQGTERSPAYVPKPTAQGTERSPGFAARPVPQTVERPTGLAGRTTGQGADRPTVVERPLAPVPSAERQAALQAAVAAQAAIVEKAMEPYQPVSTGASVRPPPMSMKSLTDVGGRTSMPNAPAIPSSGLMAPTSDLPAMWEPEAPTTPHIPQLLESLPPVRERDPSLPPPPAPETVTKPPPRLVELSELEQQMRAVSDRDALIDLTFSIASRFARIVALFMVHRGMVQGVRCIEDGQIRVINGVLMPLDSPSMLTHAANQFVPFRIDPRQKTLDARVQQLIAQQPVGEAALFPVIVKQRAVNLIYASHGQEPMGPIAFGALSLLAEQMGAAYGQLILNRKGGGS